MKLNLDCIRDILLYLESLPYNEKVSVSKYLKKAFQDKYSQDDIAYSCLMLYDASFVFASIQKASQGPAPTVISIFDITYSGQQFLQSIHSNDTYSKAKTFCSEVGNFALKFVEKVAEGVASAYIKGQLNIP